MSHPDGVHAIRRRDGAGTLARPTPVAAVVLLDELPLSVRLHWVGLAGRLLPPAALGVASAAIVLAGAVFPPLGLLCVAVAGGWGVAAALGWASASLTLTGRDLVVDRGLLPRVSTLIPLASVHLVTCRQSLAGRLLGYGMLEVDLQDGHPVRFTPVASPAWLRACILRRRGP